MRIFLLPHNKGSGCAADGRKAHRTYECADQRGLAEEDGEKGESFGTAEEYFRERTLEK